jgi:CheY-like chemotaxis protein
MPGTENILIIDDNPINLKLMSVLLMGEGYAVRSAVDSTKALQALAASLPDLILTDVQLPDIDGLELTRRIKADPATASIPVVAITAYAMSGDEEKALQAGCDAYVSKPIDTRSLPLLIRSILDARKGTR